MRYSRGGLIALIANVYMHLTLKFTLKNIFEIVESYILIFSLSFFTEHLEPRQREQDFQKRGQLSCVSRAFGALHFCCDRIGCLPDCSGK